MVDALVRPESEQTVWAWCCVTPINIKFFHSLNLETRWRLLFFYQLKMKLLLRNFSNDLIPAIGYIHVESLAFPLLVLNFLNFLNVSICLMI